MFDILVVYFTMSQRVTHFVMQILKPPLVTNPPLLAYIILSKLMAFYIFDWFGPFKTQSKWPPKFQEF